jgi:O-antigen/teichoic acid export membrane protein
MIAGMSARALRPAATAIGLLWLATLAAAGMVFLAQLLLARRLGPAEYGLFASSLATVMVLAPMAGFGLSQFRMKAYGTEGWAADRWLRPSLRFSAFTGALACVLVVGWAFFGDAVDDATRLTLLMLVPVIAGVFAVDLVGGKLRLEERHGALALWQLLMPAGRLAVAATLIALPFASAQGAALGYGLVALLIAGLAVPQLIAMQRGRMDLKGHGPRPATATFDATPGALQLWSSAWAFGVVAVLYPVFFQVSTVLLKYLGSNEQAGHYGVALAVMTAIYLFPATVYQKFLLSRLHRWSVHNRTKFWRVHRAGNVAMLAMGVVAGALLALSAPWLVPLAFGPAFADVAELLAILSLCVPIRFLSTAVGSALLTEHHMRYRVAAMLVSTVAAVLLNWAVIPRWGASGAAWATVAAETILLASMWLGTRRLSRPEPAP